MNKQKLIVAFIASLTVVAIAVGYLALGNRPRLGLDLQGGISAIYTPVLEDGAERPEDFDEVLDETIAIIRERVDSLGVAEPEISRQGDDVLVQLPGLDDPDRAREIIGTTAQLNFRAVEEIIPPGSPAYAETPPCDDPDFPVPGEDEEGVVCDAEVVGLDQIPQPLPTGTPEPGSPGPSPTATGSPATSPSPEAGTGAVVAAATGDVEVVAQESPSPALSPTPSPTATAPPDAPPDGQPLKYRVGPAALSGDNVQSAAATFGEGGAWAVGLELDDEGADLFAEITGELACRRDQGQIDQLAIVLDGRVESAPSMNPTVGCDVGITGGQASITVGGSGTDAGEDDARDLALVLKTGALPITLEPSTFETVSPTLGAESLDSGLIAGIIGLVLVAIYLVFFYRLLGVVAIGALATFGVVVTAVITLLGRAGFTLTLAGIAGIVVSIGITADSSIIFFERIGDEVALGKTARTSVGRAFQSAFRTNLAGNTVTFAAAVILYFLAVGPVRGFAFTLGLAVILDILILYFYSRAAVGLLAHGGKLSRGSIRAQEIVPAGSER